MTLKATVLPPSVSPMLFKPMLVPRGSSLGGFHAILSVESITSRVNNVTGSKLKETFLYPYKCYLRGAQFVMLAWKEGCFQMASLMQAKLLICFQLQGDLEPWPPWV